MGNKASKAIKAIKTSKVIKEHRDYSGEELYHLGKLYRDNRSDSYIDYFKLSLERGYVKSAVELGEKYGLFYSCYQFGSNKDRVNKSAYYYKIAIDNEKESVEVINYYSRIIINYLLIKDYKKSYEMMLELAEYTRNNNVRVISVHDLDARLSLKRLFEVLYLRGKIKMFTNMIVREPSLSIILTSLKHKDYIPDIEQFEVIEKCIKRTLEISIKEKWEKIKNSLPLTNNIVEIIYKYSIMKYFRDI